MTKAIRPDESAKGWIPPSFLAVFEAADRDVALQLLREIPLLNIRSITELHMTPDSDLVQLHGPSQLDIQIRLPLTPRQVQILHLLVQGSSNKEIARSLQLSHYTVRNHLTYIFRATGVRSRRELRRRLARDRTRHDAGQSSDSLIA